MEKKILKKIVRELKRERFVSLITNPFSKNKRSFNTSLKIEKEESTLEYKLKKFMVSCPSKKEGFYYFYFLISKMENQMSLTAILNSTVHVTEEGFNRKEVLYNYIIDNQYEEYQELLSDIYEAEDFFKLFESYGISFEDLEGLYQNSLDIIEKEFPSIVDVLNEFDKTKESLLSEDLMIQTYENINSIFKYVLDSRITEILESINTSKIEIYNYRIKKSKEIKKNMVSEKSIFENKIKKQ